MIVISDDEDINEGGSDNSTAKGENRKKENRISNLNSEMERSTKPEDDICVIQEVIRIKKKKNGLVIGSFHSHERNPLLRKRVKPDLCVFKCTMKKSFPSPFSRFHFKRRLFQLEQSIRPDERLNYMKLLETTMKVINAGFIRQSILSPSSQVVVRCRNTEANRINNVPVVDLTIDSDSDTIDVEQESSSDDIQELPRDSLDSEVVEIPDDLVVAESSQKHSYENIQKHPASPLSSDSGNECEEVIDLVDEDKKVLKASKPSVCEENRSTLEVQMLQDMNLLDHVPEVIDVSEDDVNRAECAEINRGNKEDDYDEEDEKELPKLTDEMEVLVYSAFRSKSNDVLSEGFNLVIRTKDIHTLRGGRWLNDEIINFYMCLLMERGELLNYPSVYCFNTFFYTKLAESGHSSLKRWTRKVDIFTFDLIIVPVHLKVHWCLLCINFPEKQIEYYDSMGGKNDKCYKLLMDYLKDEHEDKKKKSFNCSHWSYINKKDIPEQLNGSDCGVFLCTYAEYICRLAKFTFSQRDMPYFRVKMAYEILTKRLLL